MSMFGHMMIGEHYSENDEQLELEWRQQCRDDRAQQEAMELAREREQISEWAIREYLTLGGRSDFVKHLCSECGISYDKVIGNR